MEARSRRGNGRGIGMGASTTSRSDQAGYRIGLHAGGRPRPSSRGGDTLPADALIIRTPIAEDREPARVLCRSMHARTIFADIAFSDAKFNRGADRVLSGEAPHTIALVAELNSRLVGAAWATAGEYFIGAEARCHDFGRGCCAGEMESSCNIEIHMSGLGVNSPQQLFFDLLQAHSYLNVSIFY